MNLGAVLLITSARHFVMGSPCIIPFDHNNLLRGRDLLFLFTEEGTAYLAIEPKMTRQLNLNSNSSLLTERLLLPTDPLVPTPRGQHHSGEPQMFADLSSYLVFTRALSHGQQGLWME